MSPEWMPSAEESLLAEDAYVRYLGAVAVIIDPQSDVAQHSIRREVTADNREGILRHQLNMAWDSAKGVIEYCNPPELRSAKGKMEGRFRQASPLMEATVRNVFEHRADVEGYLKETFTFTLPAPFLRRAIYNALCHGRRGNITVVRLLDGVMPSEIFPNALVDRSLSQVLAREAS